MEWHEKLQFARKVAGLSLREVKAITEISDAYLCELENGRIENPSFFKMMKLLKLYNIEVADIEAVKGKDDA